MTVHHIIALLAIGIVCLAMALVIFVNTGNQAPLYLKSAFIIVGVLIALVVSRLFF